MNVSTSITITLILFFAILSCDNASILKTLLLTDQHYVDYEGIFYFSSDDRVTLDVLGGKVTSRNTRVTRRSIPIIWKRLFDAPQIAQPWVAPVVHASPVVHAAPLVHAPQPWVAPGPKFVAAPVTHAKVMVIENYHWEIDYITFNHLSVALAELQTNC